jgi:hypothetical protein
MVKGRGTAQRHCTTVWLLAGVPSILGIRCWGVRGGGDATVIHYNFQRLLVVSSFSYYFLIFLEFLVIVGAYQKRTTQQSTMTGIII